MSRGAGKVRATATAKELFTGRLVRRRMNSLYGLSVEARFTRY